MSGLPARVQDELHFHFVKSEFEAHRIFMRIHKPLHARMEHSNLGLSPVPDLHQGGRLIDEFAGPENWNQQILESRSGRKMFATR